MQQNQANKPAARVGLCADCRHHRVIQSDRGSQFYLCQLSAVMPEKFPKYPRLPVLECSGHQHVGSEADKGADYPA